jgi:cell division protein FtsI/penicillin-binding protein 2
MHTRLQEAGENQHLYKLALSPKRGKIITSDNEELVANSKSFFVYYDKIKGELDQKAVSSVASVLQVDEASISSKINKEAVWIPLAHFVKPEQAEQLKGIGGKSLGFIEEDARFYPEASMAAHITGFVGKDDNGYPKGYFGLEGKYNQELEGIAGYLVHERDALNNPILVGDYNKIPPVEGRDLILYIDRTMQFIAEEYLKNAIERYGAKGGTVTVMDPKTGGILALASYPSYYQLDYWKYPGIYYRNPAISDLYEPGSTFKVLVMAKAIEDDKVKPDDIYNETGPVEKSGYTIRTWDNNYHGKISMTEILEYSSNVGMVYVSDLLGREGMLDLFSKMGFGSSIGIDLQEEAIVPVRKNEDWKEIDLATSSFGQGIVVTPMFLLSAISSLANDGIMMEPHIVKEIREGKGKIIQLAPKIRGRLFSKETSEKLREMMVASVLHGEAKWKIPQGYRIAGKTGTAQVAVQGKYDPSKTNASFVGFLPADNPKLSILVTLKEPTSSPWGSETAAPLFFSLAREYISYLNIRP